MVSNVKQFWKIVGYDGAKELFERALPLESLSEDQITALLQRLAAAGLTSNEIINASLRPNSKSYAPLLEAHRESKLSAKRFSISVGSGPSYVASIWNADELGAEVTSA
jgi:hypothetical protein